MADDGDHPHDTDPHADTQLSDSGSESGASASGASGASAAGRRRGVRAGDALGRYELLEEVGEGGMATVYRARDTRLRRDVAVKVLFPHLARREDVVRRFQREARAAAALEHPNILRVYDVRGALDDDEPPHIVMELIRGRSLLGEIERRGATLSEVVASVGALLADALAVAHKAGVIHRDIKPANVMVADDGRVLLADFGVARLETEDSLVTRTGAVLGTPAYMSPEQASGEAATARSDLYSLGATLYHLATGQLPFTGAPAKVLAALAQGALVPPARRRAAVGPDLSRLIERLMATDPEQRVASAVEAAGELRQLAAAGGLGDPANEVTAYFADPDAFVSHRLPAVVQAQVAQAERAIADGKLPRAMALADRVSALAPDEPAVAALVLKVTEGDRASRRRRLLALIGAGALVAAAVGLGARQLLARRGDGATASAPAQDGAAIATSVMAAGRDAAPVAADPADLDAGAAPSPGRDAAVSPVDAGLRVRDVGARASALSRDAGPPVMAARDAGVGASPLDDAAVERAVGAADAAVVAASAGAVVVKNDTWCDVRIDDVVRGRNGTTIGVPAGPHTVRCEQPALGKSWTRQVTVAGGETLVVEGALLGTIELTLDVDAQIDGTPYRRGQVARVPAGRVQLQVGATSLWITAQRPCRVRSAPEVGCY